METNGSGARYGVADDALIAVMKECGFATFGYDPFRRSLTDSVPENGNTVFVRNRAAVEALPLCTKVSAGEWDDLMHWAQAMYRSCKIAAVPPAPTFRLESEASASLAMPRANLLAGAFGPERLLNV